MSRKIIFIIFILSYSLSYGQYDWSPGKLVLKNGETLKGLFKIPMNNGGPLSISKTKLEYKKDENGKKEKFDETEVDKVFFTAFDSDIGYYEYIPTSRRKMELFKLIRNGKVKLYVRTIKFTIDTGMPITNQPFQNKKIEMRKEFYMIRENETVATRVFQKTDGLSIAYKANLMTFKNHSKKYFSDCPDILSFIENDVYEDFDIAQIVEDYNLLCE
jgi:hypothetical protein